MTSIADRRAEAESQLDTLRQARGVAMLDGRPFDARPLHDLEGELDAITAAEGEAARRERQQMAMAEAERLAGLRIKLATVEEHRLEAMELAEKAARDLANAAKEALARSMEATKLMRALGVNSMHLDTYEAEHRLSLRITSALKPVTGLRGRFGQIEFPAARNPFDEPWRAAEAAVGNPDITRAMKEPTE